MDIRRATLADHDELYPIYLAAAAHDNPKAPLFSRRAYDAFLTYPFPDQLNERFVLRVDGKAVGSVTIEAPTQENTDRFFMILIVHPDERRKGYGTVLHDYALAWAKENGRTMADASTVMSVEGAPALAEAGAAFARQLGYQPALLDVARQLEISTVDAAEHDRLLAAAWSAADGYRTVFWQGIPPDELIEHVAYLDGRLITDAPMGELELEPEKVTPERIRERERAMNRRGRHTVHTGAVHEESGRLVAWTTIGLDAEAQDGHALQFITLVDPDHRGHRLGTIVKIENLRYARSVEPKLSRITTWNAAANGYMIAINEALGFRPAYGQMEWQLPLS